MTSPNHVEQAGRPARLPRLMYKATEVAEMTGLSPQKIYSLMASGELPSVKIGSAVRVRAEDLDQWLAELEAERLAQLRLRRMAPRRLAS